MTGAKPLKDGKAQTFSTIFHAKGERSVKPNTPTRYQNKHVV